MLTIVEQCDSPSRSLSFFRVLFTRAISSAVESLLRPCLLSRSFRRSTTSCSDVTRMYTEGGTAMVAALQTRLSFWTFEPYSFPPAHITLTCTTASD